jgi:hypothetical protein
MNYNDILLLIRLYQGGRGVYPLAIESKHRRAANRLEDRGLARRTRGVVVGEQWIITQRGIDALNKLCEELEQF